MNRSRPTKIRRVSPGQPISASHYNQLVDSINQLMDIVGGPPQRDTELFRVVDADEDIAPYERDKTANHLKYDDSVPAGSDPIVDWGTDDTYVSEIQNNAHLSGERVLLYYDRASGKQLVLPFTAWQLARLTSSLSAGGSATAKIYEASGGSESASSLDDVTVYDWTLRDDETVDSGTNVIIGLHRQSRCWYVFEAKPSSEDDPTPACITTLDGVYLPGLDSETQPAYALGLDSNGCLVKIPVDTC